MEFGFEARYQGTTFLASVGPENADVTLITTEPPAERLGFETGQGYWRKHLTRADLDSLALIRTFGNFRDERCFVLDQTGDQLHIAYAGHDAYHAEHLGYWMVDRGVYEAVVPAEEVTETWVERIDIPVGAAANAPTEPAPSAFGASGPPVASSAQPVPPGFPADGSPTTTYPDLSATTTIASEPVTVASQHPGEQASPRDRDALIAPAETEAETGAEAARQATEPPPPHPQSTTISTGTLIDRFGPEHGRLVFAEGTPFEQRSLPPSHRAYPCRVYRVTAPTGLAVLGGPVAPWFGQPGGGVMYELPRTIEELVDLKALERVEEAS
jgi:hypothetical protein